MEIEVLIEVFDLNCLIYVNVTAKTKYFLFKAGFIFLASEVDYIWRPVAMSLDTNV